MPGGTTTGAGGMVGVDTEGVDDCNSAARAASCDDCCGC